ncbi:MAG: hypothetical protein COA69_14255 [Robiginitomaculum sp.]|nr:MAG: hypothetical protein COA69_14255 [Robiginitomaculum sp.]
MQQNVGKLISHWQVQDVITAQQAKRMRADIELDTSQRTKNRLISSLSTMGALTVAAGVILFVASNWNVLPHIFKLFMAILLPTLPLCLAYWILWVNKAHVALGRGALIIGVLLIGAAMAIIGQVYNLEPEYTRFLGFWILLALPFVFIFKRTIAVIIVTVLTGFWIPFLLFDTVFEGVDEEWAISFLPLVYLVYAGVLYRLGKYCGAKTVDWQHTGKFLRIIGAKLGIIMMFCTTFEFYAETLNDLGLRIPENSLLLIFNLLFVAFLIFVLVKAIRAEAETVIGMVFFWFGLFIIVRYFDLFWNMLPTSLFFIAGGGVFIIGAYVLEKQRKKLLAGFDGNSVVNTVKYDE